MIPVSITPYEQGNLDGLCGYYSIVNAISLIAARGQRNKVALGQLKGHMARSRVDELIEALTVATPILQRRAGWAVSNGLDTTHMSALIAVAKRWLGSRYQLDLLVHRPFYRTATMSRQRLAHLIRCSASHGASAVIIEGRFPWNHWSVAMDVNKRGIKLLDSSRYSLVVWKGRPESRAPHFELLIPRSVIVVSARVTEQTFTALI